MVCTILLVLALAMPSMAGAQARAQFPIAYVSVQRILAESSDGKAAAKELETLRTTRTQELNAKRQELEATRLALANAGGYFSSGRRTELQAKVRQQEADLQQATQQAQTDLQEEQRKVQDRLRGELNGVLQTLARQRGYLYVLNLDTAILLAPAGANVTDEVLTRMNTAAAEREANAQQKP